jgi:hypothetical protein
MHTDGVPLHFSPAGDGPVTGFQTEMLNVSIRLTYLTRVHQSEIIVILSRKAALIANTKVEFDFSGQFIDNQSKGGIFG